MSPLHLFSKKELLPLFYEYYKNTTIHHYLRKKTSYFTHNPTKFKQKKNTQFHHSFSQSSRSKKTQHFTICLAKSLEAQKHKFHPHHVAKIILPKPSHKNHHQHKNHITQLSSTQKSQLILPNSTNNHSLTPSTCHHLHQLLVCYKVETF